MLFWVLFFFSTFIKKFFTWMEKKKELIDKEAIKTANGSLASNTTG